MESSVRKSVFNALALTLVFLSFIPHSSAVPLDSFQVVTDLYSDTVSEDLFGNEINFDDRFETTSSYVNAPRTVFSWTDSISQNLNDEYWESLVAELGVSFSMDASVTETYTVSLTLDYSATDASGADLFYYESEIDGVVEDLTQDQFSQSYSFDITGGESYSLKWFYELIGSGDSFNLVSESSLSVTSIELTNPVSVDEPSALFLMFGALLGLARLRKTK